MDGKLHIGRRASGALAALTVFLLVTTPYVEMFGVTDDDTLTSDGPGETGLGWPPETFGTTGSTAYSVNSSGDLPLGTFNYPPELRWQVNLSYDEDTLSDPMDGVAFGDFDGNGGVDVLGWGIYSLVWYAGKTGNVVKNSGLVPHDSVDLDVEGYLYLGQGFVRAEDLDNDGRDEVLLVGEPTGLGALPGFQIWLVDMERDAIVWKQSLGGSAPKGMLIEDLDDDGYREVVYMVQARNRDDYTCLNSSSGRVLWRASHFLDWDNLPLTYVMNATGSGERQIYLGARYRWRPTGGLGDIEVRFLNVDTNTFDEVLLPFGGTEPKTYILAQARGDKRPELLAFLGDRVNIYDIAAGKSVAVVHLQTAFKQRIHAWAVGDIDRDGAEEVALSEIGPLPGDDAGGNEYLLRTGIFYPASGELNLVPEDETRARAQTLPIWSQAQLYRGIPWGGMLTLAGLKVSAYEGRDVGRIWEVDMAALTDTKGDRTGIHVADLDADGEMEFVGTVVQKGDSAWIGMFEPGEPRVKVLSATREGRICYATFRDYEFSFDIVPRAGTGTILTYQLLVPQDQTPLTSWSIKSGFSNPKGEWVRLGENSGYIGLPGGGSRVIFSLNFTWDCPLEEFQDVILRITFEGDEEEDHPFGNIFRVENDVVANGVLYAVGSNGRRVDPGGWVGSDEHITIRGLTMGYEGAPDMHPPNLGGVVQWEEMGLPFNRSMVFDRGLEGMVEVDTIEGVVEGDMDLTLTVDTGSASSTPIVQHLTLLIDGTAPDVVAVLPTQEGSMATTKVTVGFILFDDKSGPDPSTMEFAVRRDGQARFSNWAVPDEFSTVSDGHNVTYFMVFDLPEGGEHQLRFRGWDMVTNGPVTTPTVAVRIDSRRITFRDLAPSGWVSSDPVTVSTTVVARGANIVNGSTISYRISTSGPFSTGPWLSAGLTGEGDSYNGSADLVLPVGADNFVQWRADDMVGSGPWLSQPLQVRVDRVAPSFGEWGPDPEVVIVADSTEFHLDILDDGAGVDGSKLEIAVWTGKGSPEFEDLPSYPTSTTITVRKQITLENGRVNFVQVRCLDVVGNGPSISPVYTLWADRDEISWSNFEPLGVNPVDGPLVNVSINVSDHGGSGVDLASLEYAILFAGGEAWNPWSPVGLWGVEDELRISLELNLTPGTESRVRFRGNDIAGTREVWSGEYSVWVNGPPMVVWERPSTGTFLQGKRISFEVSVRDGENDTVLLTWWLDDDTYLGSGGVLEISLPLGDHELTVRADDGHGNNVSLTRNVSIVTELDEEGVGMWHWVLTAIAVPLGGVAGYVIEDRKIKSRKGKGTRAD